MMNINSKPCLSVFPQPSDTPPAEKRNNLPVVDHRTVEELLTFIEGPVDRNEMDSQRSKAQKRARQKQKKVRDRSFVLVSTL